MNKEVIDLIEKTVKEQLEQYEKRISLGGNAVPPTPGPVSSTVEVAGIPIGVSARHIHVSPEDFYVLFGSTELHPKKELMGGQFAANETVTLVGLNLRVIEGVRILGPFRKQTQVELAKTDCIKLGIAAPIRESGKLSGSGAITVVGPKGALYLQEGCIIAKRHIHFNPEDAKRFGVNDGQTVSVRIGKERSGILENVQVRVDKSFTLEMHLDTDEANALDLKCAEKAYLFA